MTSTHGPSSSAAAARRELGARLRRLRRSAGLTARTLSHLIRKHHTSISKIENGAKQPTEADIIAWCQACSAEIQTDDLLTALRTIESAYIEWQRNTRAGLRRLGGLHTA